MRYFWLAMVIISVFPFVMVFRSPGLVGALTLFVSFFMAILVGHMRSVWYGLSLWLVYVSGLMVLFLFFCALTPNPLFELPLPNKVGGVMVLVLFLVQVCMGGYGVCYFWGPESSVQLFILYQGGSSGMILWFGCYLLVTMVAVVKVAPKGGGALREFGSQNLRVKKMKSDFKPGWEFVGMTSKEWESKEAVREKSEGSGF